MNIEHRSRFTYEYKVIQPDKIVFLNIFKLLLILLHGLNDSPH